MLGDIGRVLACSGGFGVRGCWESFRVLMGFNNIYSVQGHCGHFGRFRVILEIFMVFRGILRVFLCSGVIGRVFLCSGVIGRVFLCSGRIGRVFLCSGGIWVSFGCSGIIGRIFVFRGIGRVFGCSGGELGEFKGVRGGQG